MTRHRPSYGIPPPPIGTYALWTKVVLTANDLDRDIQIVHDFMNTPDWRSRSILERNELSEQMRSVENEIHSVQDVAFVVRQRGAPTDEPFVDNICRDLRRIGAALRNLEFDKPLAMTHIGAALVQVKISLVETRHITGIEP